MKYLKELFGEFFCWMGRAFTIGIAVALSIFIGAAAGYYLDMWIFGKTQILFYIFLMLGVIAGFRNIWILGKKFQKEEKEKKKDGQK